MAISTTINLPSSPPGFRGLDPDKQVDVYYRHLPHWRQDSATYFVTFRLADSLPQEKIDFLQRLRTNWEQTQPTLRSKDSWEQQAREVTKHVERWLDQGDGACHFQSRHHSDDLRQRLDHFQDERYQISCWAIMPNHCHLVIRPLGGNSLEDLVGAIKGVSARHLNSELGLEGALWEEESYDRIIRDEEHLWNVIQYIGRNPAKAGLGREDWRRWIRPDWEKAGWGFRQDEG